MAPVQSNEKHTHLVHLQKTPPSFWVYILVMWPTEYAHRYYTGIKYLLKRQVLPI